MYVDSKPCSVCGSEVELRARRTPIEAPSDGLVGPQKGYVGDGDSPVDERFCSNPDCPTHDADRSPREPRP